MNELEPAAGAVQRERYAPGYDTATTEFMARRRALTHARFMFPYLRAGMDLLDCGCGPGTITTDLAEHVMPGHTVGIDINTGLIDLAQAHAAARGLPNTRFDTANVYTLPFADHSFDAVFAHALLDHLTDPVAALGEMRRVLRPGGTVGVCSPDWGGCIITPTDPELDAAIAFYKLIQTRNGGNVIAGRYLGTWLGAAGFVRVKMHASYECYENLEQIAEYLAHRIEFAEQIDGAVSAGWVTYADLEFYAAALRAWSKRSDGLFAQTWIEAIGRIER